MNRNLLFCFGVVFVALLLPVSIFNIGEATPEWSLFWQVRTYLVTYSGMVSMILMSLCIILSVKHWPVVRWPIEKWLGGLDQQYRLHKYLGISAAFSALFHWASFLSDDFAMDLGFVTPKDETFPFWTLVEALGDPAQLIGEYGFYFTAAFVLIAWIKKFKHNVFQFSHKLFPYLYLLLVLHMVMFFDASLWLTFPGLVLLMTSTLATVGSLLTILGFNGKQKRYPAKVERFTPMNNGVEVVLKVDPQNSEAFQFKPGQFAFIGFGDKERAHPFSLASACHRDGTVRLLIKANGDYTNALINSLKVGQAAQVEGPYGCFNFDDEAKQHIWFAAGIGIAPFLTAIEAVGKNKTVSLYYSFREKESALLAELKQRAIEAGVDLHVIDTTSQSRFASEEIISNVQDINQCSVWFCGPSELGKRLERDFAKAKLPSKAFHRELFEFR